MDVRSYGNRFIDSFAEEMGRWSARIFSAGVIFAIGLLATDLMR